MKPVSLLVGLAVGLSFNPVKGGEAQNDLSAPALHNAEKDVKQRAFDPRRELTPLESMTLNRLEMDLVQGQRRGFDDFQTTIGSLIASYNPFEFSNDNAARRILEALSHDLRFTGCPSGFIGASNTSGFIEENWQTSTSGGVKLNCAWHDNQTFIAEVAKTPQLDAGMKRPVAGDERRGNTVAHGPKGIHGAKNRGPWPGDSAVKVSNFIVDGSRGGRPIPPDEAFQAISGIFREHSSALDVDNKMVSFLKQPLFQQWLGRHHTARSTKDKDGTRHFPNNVQLRFGRKGQPVWAVLPGRHSDNQYVVSNEAGKGSIGAGGDVKPAYIAQRAGFTQIFADDGAQLYAINNYNGTVTNLDSDSSTAPSFTAWAPDGSAFHSDNASPGVIIKDQMNGNQGYTAMSGTILTLAKDGLTIQNDQGTWRFGDGFNLTFKPAHGKEAPVDREKVKINATSAQITGKPEIIPREAKIIYTDDSELTFYGMPYNGELSNFGWPLCASVAHDGNREQFWLPSVTGNTIYYLDGSNRDCPLDFDPEKLF